MELTLITVVAVHLMAVNLAGAGPLLAAWIDWRGTRNSRPDLQRAAGRLVVWSIVAAAVGVAIGFGAWQELVYWAPKSQHSFKWMLRESISTTRWWFIGAEIAFYFVCAIGAAWLWRRGDVWKEADQNGPRVGPRWLPRLLAIAAGTNFLYHFPPLFTIIAIKFEQHDWSGELDHQAYLHWLMQSETIARVLHVWLASFAAAGLALSWIGVRLPATDGAEKKPSVAAIGGRWALWATMLQIPVGVWVLFALPDVQGDNIMTGSPLFAIAVVTALGLMHQLAMLSLGNITLRRLSVSTLLMIVVILLMTAALQCSRPI